MRKKKKIKGIVYLYRNTINDKIYIGQTLDEKRRKRKHKYARDNYPFHNAIRKYGYDKFEYKVLFYTSSKSKERLKVIIDALEIYYIRKYNSTDKNIGYNLAKGGDGTVGVVLTKETKDKISATKRSQHLHHSKERKEYMSKINTGRVFSPESRVQLSNSRSGIPVSKDTKIKISNSLKGNPAYNRLPVLQLSLDGKVLNEFSSAVEAGKSLGKLSGSKISQCCKGNRKTAYGFKWKYKDKTHYVPKSIVQLTMDGDFIKEYSSMNDILENFLKPTGITSLSNLKTLLRTPNKRSTAYGFRWMYKEDYEKSNNFIKEENDNK